MQGKSVVVVRQNIYLLIKAVAARQPKWLHELMLSRGAMRLRQICCLFVIAKSGYYCTGMGLRQRHYA